MKDTLINKLKDKSTDLSGIQTIQTIQNIVMDWIMTCVIGWNLCPFAAKSITENRLRIHVLNDAHPTQLLTAIHQASTQMLVHEQWLNTLIVTPNHWQDFYDFWEILAQVEDYVFQQGWEGKIQVVSFHPQYQFEGEMGASIFSNRSPYPIFHLLHEAEMSHTISQYPHAEEIAVKNVQRLQHMGLAHIKKVFTQHQWTHALIDDKHQ
jgi:uncharacterized protein